MPAVKTVSLRALSQRLHKPKGKTQSDFLEGGELDGEPDSLRAKRGHALAVNLTRAGLMQICCAK